jgi:hypothetical protein
MSPSSTGKQPFAATMGIDFVARPGHQMRVTR